MKRKRKRLESRCEGVLLHAWCYGSLLNEWEVIYPDGSKQYFDKTVRYPEVTTAIKGQ